MHSSNDVKLHDTPGEGDPDKTDNNTDGDDSYDANDGDAADDGDDDDDDDDGRSSACPAKASQGVEQTLHKKDDDGDDRGGVDDGI